MKRWMVFPLLLVVVAAAALLRPAASTAPLPPATPFTIENITLIDVNTGASRNASVTIDGERITEIAPARSARAANTPTRVVDGRGKYLIPGLWDMHVHWPSNQQMSEHYGRLLVANGVTAVRKMNSGWSRPGQIQRSWNPSAVTPRAFASGRMVNGPGGKSGASVVLRTPADVDHALDTLAATGSDFVKIYNGVPRAAYFALLAEARRRGKDVAGHVPWSVTAVEASDSGQRSFEHLAGILMSCSPRESELRAELAQAHDRGDFVQNMPGQRAEAEAMRTYDRARCRAVADRLAANGTWVVPTLATSRKKAGGNVDPAVAYMPGWTRTATGKQKWWESRPPEMQARLRGTFELESATVRLLHDAGVPLLAGTDMPAQLVVPGFSLHEELELLADAGLTPLEALQSATIQPARYFGALDSLGTIDTGKIADLVILDADPRVDINNTRRIAAVVLRGRYLDQSPLDELLADSRRFARDRNIASAVTRLWCSVAPCSPGD